MARVTPEQREQAMINRIVKKEQAAEKKADRAAAAAQRKADAAQRKADRAAAMAQRKADRATAKTEAAAIKSAAKRALKGEAVGIMIPKVARGKGVQKALKTITTAKKIIADREAKKEKARLAREAVKAERATAAKSRMITRMAEREVAAKKRMEARQAKKDATAAKRAAAKAEREAKAAERKASAPARRVERSRKGGIARAAAIKAKKAAAMAAIVA
jgi:hypothetical protein